MKLTATDSKISNLSNGQRAIISGSVKKGAYVSVTRIKDTLFFHRHNGNVSQTFHKCAV